MPRRRKYQVRKGFGIMCNMCGKNCGRGGPLKSHVEGRKSAGGHELSYETYPECFYGAGKILADSWDDSIRTARGKTVMIHTMVRRLVGSPGHRGATRTATPRHRTGG